MLRKREYDVATVIPKNNDIRLRRASAGRLNSTALITIHFRQNNAAHFFITNSLPPKQRRKFFITIHFRQSSTAHFFIIIRFRSAKTHLENERVARRENRGIHERDPCRLTWAISGDFRLVVLGILLYSCVLRTKTRSKIAPWQVQRSFARRICAKAMKRPQTIRSLLARALKMHRCKSVGQNRHVSLPCMP